MEHQYAFMLRKIQKLEQESQEKDNQILRLKQEIGHMQSNLNMENSDKGLSQFDADSEKSEQIKIQSQIHFSNTPLCTPKNLMKNNSHEYIS